MEKCSIVKELEMYGLLVGKDKDMYRVVGVTHTDSGSVITTVVTFPRKFAYVVLPVLYHAYVMTVRYTQVDGLSMLHVAHELYIKGSLLLNMVDISSNNTYAAVETTSIAS